MPPHGKKFANYWHGSQPVRSRRNPVTKLGKAAEKQWTATRHYALATISVSTFVTAGGEYFNLPYFANNSAFAWLERNRLIDREPPNRPGGAQELCRNADGDRVLARWNAEHGEVSTSDPWEDC